MTARKMQVDRFGELVEAIETYVVARELGYDSDIFESRKTLRGELWYQYLQLLGDPSKVTDRVGPEVARDFARIMEAFE